MSLNLFYMLVQSCRSGRKFHRFNYITTKMLLFSVDRWKKFRRISLSTWQMTILLFVSVRWWLMAIQNGC